MADLDYATAFGGSITPPSIINELFALGITQTSLARRLTQRPVMGGGATYPLVNPSGFAWRDPGDTYASITIGDGALIVPLKGLGGIVGVPEVLFTDSEVSVLTFLGSALAEAMSLPLDLAAFSGDPLAKAPDGLLNHAPSIGAQPSLFAGIIASVAALAAKGGSAPTHAFVSPEAWALEASRMSTTEEPIYPGGIVSISTVEVVATPSLVGKTDALVIDAGSVDLVLGHLSRVAVSDQIWFDRGLIAVRVDLRCTVAAPTPLKSLAKFTITP
jgi:hypothetical protein